MFHHAIPGFGEVVLEHLVMDYNGTLAVDGILIQGVPDMLVALSSQMTLHVITADTFGMVQKEMADMPVQVKILPLADQDQAKKDYIRELGADRTAAIGNGRNDRLMLEAAALGIALILKEGAAARTMAVADVVCTDIRDALALFLNPKRLTATLRC